MICRNDEELRSLRNCDGKFDPVCLVFDGVPFDCCPTSWRIDHPQAVAMWEQYVDCTGGAVDEGVRFWPFEGTVGDQPHCVVLAFRLMANLVQRHIVFRQKDPV